MWKVWLTSAQWKWHDRWTDGGIYNIPIAEAWG